jgi:hypothetical protein
METDLLDVIILSNDATSSFEIVENKFVEPVCISPTVNHVTYNEYQNDPNCLGALKLSQLREALKFYKNTMVIPNTYSSPMKRDAKNAIKTLHDFALVGTKHVLTDRLRTYLIQEGSAVHIQRVVRGHFVRYSIRLRGVALKNRKMCVNDSDFYSLEPLENIPFLEFFSYTDPDNFTYGFEIESLYAYLKRKTRNVKNPYNRGNMDAVVMSIRTLERLITIMNTPYIVQERILPIKTTTKPSSARAPQNTSRTRRNTGAVVPNTVNTYNHIDMIEHIRNIRTRPFLERCRLLFMDIDQLGNYTQYQWFTQLDRRGSMRFYRILKDIWTYRAQIPTSVKAKICPLWDPFIMISSNSIVIAELSLDQIQNVCVSIMEDMVYTGVDTEYRTIGAFHVLSALTVVNSEARVNMPWLYESLVW